MENVYSQAKIFHFHDKLRELEQGTVGAPIHVRLKPINACNHRCFYCCYRSESLFLSELMNEKDMIPREKMREIVEDMAEMGVKAVTFTGGGEPLIYPHIVETAGSLLSREVKVAALTNGSALKGEIAEVLASGASWVRISIDAADRESFSKSRAVSVDEFDTVVRNIAAFAAKKHPGCELGINFIITRLNYQKVYDFATLMKEKGVNHIKISECIVSTSGKENTAYHQEYFDRVASEIARADHDLSDEHFKIINKFHDFADKFDKKYTRCPFIHFLNVIAADQTVYTCQDKAYTRTGILGSIKDQRLRDLWMSDGYKKNILSLNPAKVCNHHCVSHGKNLSLIDYMTTDTHHLEFV